MALDLAPFTAATKPPRHYLPESFTVTDWEQLAPYYDQLLAEEPASPPELEAWLRKVDELDCVVQETLGWRFIRMTRNNADAEAQEAYEYFLRELSPRVQEKHHALNLKYWHSPHRAGLDAQKYRIFNQLVEKDIELYRPENVELSSRIEMKAQDYGSIASAMTVEVDGEEQTLQQAAVYLQFPDRPRREEVWKKVANRRLQDRQALHELLDELIALRTELARNAGYESFTDYMFRSLGRFDYGREETEAFRHAIESVVKPLHNELQAKRRHELGLEHLRPWDLAVDSSGAPPLRPFTTEDELIDQAVNVLAELRPELGQMIHRMRELRHLDLASRIGKSPGGYNYPLNETGVPYIFMNAAGVQGDLTTMVHEAGHAVHSFLTRDLEFSFFKDVPSELAELAAMSMELLTMDHWGLVYDQEADLRRARHQQLERAIGGLPWIATIDAFQTWLYDNPEHSHDEREAKWVELHRRYNGDEVDYSGFEDYRRILWQRQLHIYEVPFYYIEYGMAQLGALQVWRNVKADPERGLQQYLEGLRLGYTRSIDDVYAAAGIRFDFSEPMIRELFAFVREELENV